MTPSCLSVCFVSNCVAAAERPTRGVAITAPYQNTKRGRAGYQSNIQLHPYTIHAYTQIHSHTAVRQRQLESVGGVTVHCSVARAQTGGEALDRVAGLLGGTQTGWQYPYPGRPRQAGRRVV